MEEKMANTRETLVRIEERIKNLQETMKQNQEENNRKFDSIFKKIRDIEIKQHTKDVSWSTIAKIGGVIGGIMIAFSPILIEIMKYFV